MSSTTPAPKGASKFTLEHNKKVAEELSAFQPQNPEDATRGLIAPLPDDGKIVQEDGKVVLDLPRFAFLDDPETWQTVNPSLALQSRLMRHHGLFEVCERIYQVRGIGSSISFIEGDTGLIIIDGSMSLAGAKTALDLYSKHRGKRQVKAMIISHPHGDHFGGLAALLDEEELGQVKIYAPAGYTEALISESLFAGNPMRRRAGYMFGMFLPVEARGNAGIGLSIYNTYGRRKALMPTDFITHTGQKLHLDGLDFEFQLALDGEAPVELHWYIPQLKALTLSETAEQTMHNTYTLRGAKTRNPAQWSKIIQEALDMWGDQAETLYMCHGWPVWGNAQIRRHLGLARDGYRYLNDRTLHLASLGHTPDEIGDLVRFPEELERHWAMRGHYGSVSHNARSTYDYYLGFYNGNPATLNPLPHEQSAPRYVEMMGGAGKILEKASQAFENGEYRWVAELLNHLVFAEPDNARAKNLLADAYEQMGYQAEAAPWRNNYLTAAMELRNGVRKAPVPPEGAEEGMTLSLLADYLSIRIDQSRAAALRFDCNVTLADGSIGALYVSNGVISHSLGRHAPDAQMEIKGPLPILNRLIFGSLSLEQATEQGLEIKGDKRLLADLLACRASFEPWFNIVTP
ncbi:MBL fold metallo-hydrolase [Desulfovibrio sp. OttesenSCG-928-C14]|nr:MBL fold metallo-hydrolase [Desulfovibrio sp. OttesenSCG-928-C14]